MRLRPGPSASLFAAVVIAAGLGGCRPSDEGAQPSPDPTTFEQGDFGDIPLLPTSEPLSPRNEEDGTVARSYAVRNTTPDEVLDFYEEQLAEAEVLEPPASIGTDTVRGRWQLDQGRVLTISATLSRNLSEIGDLPETEAVTQYSLSLSPGGG